MDQKIKNENEVPAKKIKITTDNNVGSNIGWKMMKNMGWEGQGLGAQNQGVQEPVAASKHANRHGLGLKDEDLGIETPSTIWHQGMDEASVTGDIVIGIEGSRTYFENNDLVSGKLIGKRSNSIANENTFCDPSLLSEMLKCKSVLDKYGIILDGRARSNPYERIGSGFFLNRAAMKMANLDYIFSRLFSGVANNETLYFADVCAGPGGFTEYMLWRRPLQSCGFGFTLKGKDDFKLKQIVCGPVECFHPSYGANDDGDITNEDNLKKFQEEVMSGTSGIGVHTVMADGGFDVSGNESIQELLSKQLYLCQFLCAINILRTGGNFVCKLFDTFTDFSVGLIHLVSTLFEKITIVKPITSRPANSERYIVFSNFTDKSSGRVEEIRNFLYDINQDLNNLKNTDQDVTKIIHQYIIKKDIKFYQFIKDVNNKILRQQIIALAKLHTFLEDRNLIDDRQSDIRKEAMNLWKIPEDLKREQFLSEKANSIVSHFISQHSYKNRLDKIKPPAQKSILKLSEEEFLKDKFCVRNHYAAIVGSQGVKGLSKSLYVVVKDRKNLNFFEEILSQPSPLSDEMKLLISIPSFTILLVNFGLEYSGKGNRIIKSAVIVDSPLIYGEDISELSYIDRMEKITNLCSLLDYKCKGVIRPINYFPLSDIKDFISKYSSMRKAKGKDQSQMITCKKTDHFYAPDKLIIINTINEPWLEAVSKTKGTTYYFNVPLQKSQFEKPADLYASYVKSIIYELDWKDSNDVFDTHKLLSLIDRKA